MIDAICVILLLTLLAAIAFKLLNWIAGRAHVKLERSRENRCRACGYDLRASRENCPECGAPIPKSSRVSLEQIDFELLNSRWPREHFAKRTPGPQEWLVEVAASTDGGKIELLADYLQVHGIAGLVQMAESKEMHGTVTIQKMCLSVWSEDVDQVMEIVASLSLNRIDDPSTPRWAE